MEASPVDSSGGAIPPSARSIRSTGSLPYLPTLEEKIKQVNLKSLSDVVLQSQFSHLPQAEQVAAIVKTFNKNVKDPVIVNAGARAGHRIQPGLFMLAHKNRVPELFAGNNKRMIIALTGGYTETGYIGGDNGFHKQTEPVIGAFGSYVVNVPQGSFAKIWSGQIPRLLGEGSHVIHDPQFRVEAGAQIDEASRCFLLEDDRNFFVSQSDNVIMHNIIRIIRVPVGSIASVTVDTVPLFLPYRPEAYVFVTPIFNFGGFSLLTENFIDNGPLHIVRVPGGSVLRIWLGSKPLILESRDEPYFFDDANFKVEKGVGDMADSLFDGGPGSNPPFVSCFKKTIKHGTILRLRPGVNGELEQAVLQRGTEFEFVSKSIIINDPICSLVGYINTGLQTLIFPSARTVAERQANRKDASWDEIHYEPMTTRDSLKVGLKLLVAIQVVDPALCLTKLRLQDIIEHVENLAVSDMARAVQHSNSQNFLHTSGNTQHHDEDKVHELPMVDQVRHHLVNHLRECGIKLIRFNVEEAKVFDKVLQAEMSKQALLAAQVSAQQSVIEQKTAIAEATAQLEAMADRVRQEQENKILISIAKTDLESAKMLAEASVVMAEAEQKSKAMMGSVYQKYPQLLELSMTETNCSALNNSIVQVIAPQCAVASIGIRMLGTIVPPEWRWDD